MDEPAASPDPPFAAIAAELELGSLLASQPTVTPAVESVRDRVVAGQRRGGTQLLGLHLAFVALAEALAADRASESLPGHDAFDNTKKRAGGARAVDTLTIIVPAADGRERRFGIRRFVNRAIEAFKGPRLRRTGYPSSPMQHTKRWADWAATLDAILAMSRTERRGLAEALYAEVLRLPKDVPRVAARTVQDPFVQVIRDFPRAKRSGERPGAALQGIAYGFVCADAPGLTPRSAKVHTGARRAGLVGDVDGYDGPFLQLAVEVKDRQLTDFAELTDFLSNLADYPDATAFVICADASAELRERCAAHAIAVLTLGEMTSLVRLWVAGKQARAVREALAYYQGIEHSPALANRFVEFLEARGIDFSVS